MHLVCMLIDKKSNVIGYDDHAEFYCFLDTTHRLAAWQIIVQASSWPELAIRNAYDSKPVSF